MIGSYIGPGLDAWKKFFEDPSTSFARYKTVRSLYDYVTGSPKDETQYFTQSLLGGFTPMGGIYRALDDMSFMRDYMNERGIDWNDIRYRTRTPGWGFGNALSDSVKSVSKNITKLYE